MSNTDTLKQCNSCASDIRAKASICPVCKKKQGMGTLRKIGLWILAFVMLASILEQQSPPKPVRTPEQIEADQRKEALRVRARDVQKEIKRSLKNPDSFKLDRAAFTTDETICVTYRAANSFNAIVPGVAYDRKGLLQFDSDGFARHCLKPNATLQDLM